VRPNISIRQLLYFVTVAEERHFRRAAERLHVSQPPLTQGIQAMERDLGIPLFARRGHKIELTDAGELMLPEARAVLAQVDRLREVARQAEQGEAGHLRIAVTMSVPFIRAFTQATKAFQSDYPDIVLELVQENSSQAIESLRQHKIDICLIRRVSPRLTGFEQTTVARDRLMLVLPSDHPAAAAEKVSLGALVEERFILFRGAALYGQIMDVWARAGVTPRVHLEAWNGFAILALVAAGFGNAILPDLLSAIHMPNIVWKAIDLDERWTSSSIVMIYRTEAPNEKLLSRFVGYIQQYSSAADR
jgi:DNA-binding transcriptional LysR family regulator